MSKINDGGAAFPCPATENHSGQGGMTLRDYFAGQALLALAKENQTEFGVDEITRLCGRYADSMLKERAS